MSPNSESGNPLFDDLFAHSDEQEELKSETKLLSFKFLSEFERYSDKSKGLKKRLAEFISTSPSYITQLFNGDKIINLETVAKFQKALKIKFKIIAYPADEYDYIVNSSQGEMVKNIFIFKDRGEDNTERAEAKSTDFTRIERKPASFHCQS